VPLTNLICNTPTTPMLHVATPTDAEKTIRRIDYISRFGVYLLKGGMDETTLKKHLQYYALGRYSGTYTADEKKLSEDVHMAVDKANLEWFEPNKKSFAETVLEWARLQDGTFSLQNGYNELHLATPAKKKHFRTELSRLITRGILEKSGTKSGVYRTVKDDAEVIDISKIKYEELPLKLPLDLHDLFIPQPKNVIVVAGERDAGKSCFCLNTARMNMNRGIQIYYYTSEMGGAELAYRLKGFEPDIPYEDWYGVNWRSLNRNFQDSIDPNGINIIDYLKLDTDFYLIGGIIRQIFAKLDKGICIIAMQKNSDKDWAVGGEATKDEARLYVTLSSNPPEGGIAKIEKAKNWRDPSRNPNYLECNYKIYKGAQMTKTLDWGRRKKGGVVK